MPAIKIKDGKIDRKFSEDWLKQGQQTFEHAVELVSSAVAGRPNMVDYIKQLHDKIDELLLLNEVANVPQWKTQEDIQHWLARFSNLPQKTVDEISFVLGNEIQAGYIWGFAQGCNMRENIYGAMQLMDRHMRELYIAADTKSGVTGGMVTNHARVLTQMHRIMEATNYTPSEHPLSIPKAS